MFLIPTALKSGQIGPNPAPAESDRKRLSSAVSRGFRPRPRDDCHAEGRGFESHQPLL